MPEHEVKLTQAKASEIPYGTVKGDFVVAERKWSGKHVLLRVGEIQKTKGRDSVRLTPPSSDYDKPGVPSFDRKDFKKVYTLDPGLNRTLEAYADDYMEKNDGKMPQWMSVRSASSGITKAVRETRPDAMSGARHVGMSKSKGMDMSGYNLKLKPGKKVSQGTKSKPMDSMEPEMMGAGMSRRGSGRRGRNKKGGDTRMNIQMR